MIKTLIKTTAITTTALLLAMTAPPVFLRSDAAAFSELISLNSIQFKDYNNRDSQNTDTQVSSLRVTQSTEDGGLEIQCEGNLKCEMIDDQTVIAGSKHNNTTTIVSTMTATTTTATSVVKGRTIFFSTHEKLRTKNFMLLLASASSFRNPPLVSPSASLHSVIVYIFFYCATEKSLCSLASS